MNPAKNLDEATVRSFGEEWSRFDQSASALSEEELVRMFREYFAIFPWEALPPHPRGADIGCGTGRWARLVANRVAELHCVDASPDALAVARSNLEDASNVVFHHANIDALPFEEGSLDFAFSLGVLHHLPDTAAALRACARVLKPGAPFLLYLYYAFDHRSLWFRTLWHASDGMRRVISGLDPGLRDLACDALAALVYWPLARGSRLLERLGEDVSSLPLSIYRERSFYSMRTDSRDRFGTPVESRFRADEISEMMAAAGLVDVRFSPAPPYWCAVGIRSRR
jgi:SAM-dependent methyltransferase